MAQTHTVARWPRPLLAVVAAVSVAAVALGCAAGKSTSYHALRLDRSGMTAGGAAADDAGADLQYSLYNRSEAPVDPSRPAAGSTGTGTGTAGGGAPGLKPPAPVVSPDADPQAEPAAAARQVIYSAAFRVVVADVPGTLRSIREAAERMGGHLQEVAGSAITVRVPSARFNDAVEVVEKSGEVVDRQVRAQDVTEEMRDLRIRLDNAEQLRKRLQGLLEKADKVEDAIKIEAELARVSEQIDTTKGRIRYLDSQIAMSTLRVELNSPVPQNPRGTGPRLPFDWVNDLGEGLVAGQVRQDVKRAGFFGKGPMFKPPGDFVRYFEQPGWTEAMDAAGLMLRVQQHRNVDKAPLSFWSTLVRRTLVENRALAVASEGGDNKVYVLTGTRDIGGQPVGYVVSVERDADRVIVFEAWGPQDLFDQRFAALRESAVSIEPG